MNLSKRVFTNEFIWLLFIMSCSTDEVELRTQIKFLYEDCLNSPVKHTSTIPSNIVSLKVSLIRDNKAVYEKEFSNSNASEQVILNDIEPYDRYRVFVRALTKDNIYWSGFAENVGISPKSKTFVQINLTRERSLTCADYLNNKRFMHSSVNFGDGRIFIFGGAGFVTRDYETYHIEGTKKAEIFYPYKVEQSSNVNTKIIAGSSNTLASEMSSGRIGYIYEILPDGKILIAGGLNKADLVKNPDDFFVCLNNESSFVKEIEIFDPAKETFEVIGSLNSPFAFASSARIGNKIFIIGGISADFDCKSPVATGRVIVIDITDIKSLKISEVQNEDAAFFASGRIEISDNKYLFYGGNREDGLLLTPDGRLVRVTFELSPELSQKNPQKGYFPEAFRLSKDSNLFLNVAGYYRGLNDRYYIKYVSDNRIQIIPDKSQQNLLFGSSNIVLGSYLIQSGGIKEFPFVVGDSFILRRLTQSGYELIDKSLSGVEKLKRERAFHSSVKMDDNNILITGGLFFDQENNAIPLDLAEIYNGYGLE